MKEFDIEERVKIAVQNFESDTTVRSRYFWLIRMFLN